MSKCQDPDCVRVDNGIIHTEACYDTIMADYPVTDRERRDMGDDMLYPTYDIFGRYED